MTAHAQRIQLCTLGGFSHAKMASNSLCLVELETLRQKYSEIDKIIALEHLKIKRETPADLRQAILENIINWKMVQFDLKTRMYQLEAQK